MNKTKEHEYLRKSTAQLIDEVRWVMFMVDGLFEKMKQVMDIVDKIGDETGVGLVKEKGEA